jgi:hypothetical protein
MPMKIFRHADDSSAMRMLIMPTLLVVIALMGCRQKVKYQPPKTYSVTGKVIAPPGKAPAGSVIQFVPKDVKLTAHGAIEEDGSFALKTLFHEHLLPGAIEGVHRVIVLPVVNNGPGKSITIKQSYTVEPKDNNFSIKLD